MNEYYSSLQHIVSNDSSVILLKQASVEAPDKKLPWITSLDKVEGALQEYFGNSCIYKAFHCSNIRESPYSFHPLIHTPAKWGICGLVKDCWFLSGNKGLPEDSFRYLLSRSRPRLCKTPKLIIDTTMIKHDVLSDLFTFSEENKVKEFYVSFSDGHLECFIEKPERGVKVFISERSVVELFD